MTQRNLFSKAGLPGQMNLFPDRAVPEVMVSKNYAQHHYDYERQCWIVDGKIDQCGHTTPRATCYACQHAGEEV